MGSISPQWLCPCQFMSNISEKWKRPSFIIKPWLLPQTSCVRDQGMMEEMFSSGCSTEEEPTWAMVANRTFVYQLLFSLLMICWLYPVII